MFDDEWEQAASQTAAGLRQARTAGSLPTRRVEYPTLAQGLAYLRCYTELPADTVVTVRQPYEAGRLIFHRVLHVVAYGRTLGLDIEMCEGGNTLLTKRGILRIAGHPRPVYQTLKRLNDIGGI